MRSPRRWNWKIWMGAVLGVVVLLGVGGPFVYIHFVEGDPPRKLSVAASTGDQQPSVPVAGQWQVGPGSQVGYRVKETLFGQSTTAVGRTKDVTGSMSVTPTTVTAASFTAQMTSVTSDQGGRDSEFRGRIMNVDQYPTASFTMTAPLALGRPPAAAQTKQYTVTGKLTLHGHTRTVTVTLEAKRSGETIALGGAIPVHFKDYGISNPSGGPASVGSDGSLEVLLVMTHTA